MSRTTKRQYELFKKEVRRCAKILSLTNWNIQFSLTALKDAAAEVEVMVNDQTACIYLNTRGPWTDDELLTTARHEIIHVLIGGFSALAHDRSATIKALIREEEALVNRLTETLTPVFENKK